MSTDMESKYIVDRAENWVIKSAGVQGITPQDLDAQFPHIRMAIERYFKREQEAIIPKQGHVLAPPPDKQTLLDTIAVASMFGTKPLDPKVLERGLDRYKRLFERRPHA